jgi:hypothetical protein
MRFFAIAADIAMGVFLGFFLYAFVIRLWPSTAGPVTGCLVVAASVLIVLFRQPNGSLAVRRDNR